MVENWNWIWGKLNWVMGAELLVVCHGLVTALIVVSFLCGRWPIFEGTFIQRFHYFLTFGAYDYFLYSTLSFSLSYFPFHFHLSSFLILFHLSGVSLALFLALIVPMRFFLSNITAAIVPILSYRFRFRFRFRFHSFFFQLVQFLIIMIDFYCSVLLLQI